MDSEKIIKALQNCSVQNDVGCQGCPYFEERKIYGHEWCTTSMAQDALALLKEQEAVKPIPYHRSDGTIFKYECRQCRTKIFKMDLFCRRCGRKVKWND